MTPRCERRGCDGRELVERHDRTIGRISFVCPECERVKARNVKGLCADCPAPRPDTHSKRCRSCAALREKRRNADRQRDRFRKDQAIRDRKNAQRRAKYANDPAFRQYQIEYTREYVKAHPRPKRDSLENLYHAAWSRAHPLTNAQRRRVAERHKHRYATDPEYRERHRRNAKARYRRLVERRQAQNNQPTGVAA